MAEAEEWAEAMGNGPGGFCQQGPVPVATLAYEDLWHPAVTEAPVCRLFPCRKPVAAPAASCSTTAWPRAMAWCFLINGRAFRAGRIAIHEPTRETPKNGNW